MLISSPAGQPPSMAALPQKAEGDEVAPEPSLLTHTAHWREMVHALHRGRDASDVWTDRASQKGFWGPANDLASMYSASLWSAFAPGHDGYQRVLVLISGPAGRG